MQVTLLDRNMVDSDLGVVNAAKVSLHKQSLFLSESDLKLIRFLATHNHFTPFTHASMVFEIEWKNEKDELYFYKNRNPVGFQHIQLYEPLLSMKPSDVIKGSLFAWSMNLNTLPFSLREYIHHKLSVKYPYSMSALLPAREDEPFSYNHGGCQIFYSFLEIKNMHDLLPFTLLCKVPIAIARQIRTSQVGFTYSDIYVEGESFAYNEVSRRYVNEPPEFYKIKEWRVREGNRVKQGSTGIGDDEIQQSLGKFQQNILGYFSTEDSLYGYWSEKKVAPEQLRFLLPQSMYTEFWMTGTLKRWKQFIELREKSDVQQETRDFVTLVKEVLPT